MVIDERIGAVEESLRSVSVSVSIHEARIGALEDHSDRVEALLVEIRDDVRAQRSRLDRLTDATTEGVRVVAAAGARALDAIGHRVIVLLLMAFASLFGGWLGLDPAGLVWGR
jgi:hypothetical protein